MTKIDFYYKAAFSNSILKRIFRIFPMKYDCTHLYSCYLFEIIAIFWREKSQNLLVLESSFWEQRSKYPFFGNLSTTDSSSLLYVYILLIELYFAGLIRTSRRFSIGTLYNSEYRQYVKTCVKNCISTTQIGK